MRGCDLGSGANKLGLALRDLQLAWHATGHAWRDTARYQFETKYLVPLEPEVKRAVDAIGRLEQVLAEAYRACDDP
jgi:hypothetical protein